MKELAIGEKFCISYTHKFKTGIYNKLPTQCGRTVDISFIVHWKNIWGYSFCSFTLLQKYFNLESFLIYDFENFEVIIIYVCS